MLTVFATPVHDSIIIAAVNGRYMMRRLLLWPTLQHLDRLNELLDARSLENEQQGGDAGIFGVIAYIINDARTKIFDDNPGLGVGSPLQVSGLAVHVSCP